MQTPMKIERKELIITRDFRIDDRNFILATWLRGLYYGDSWFSNIPKAIFMENMHRVLEKYLANTSVKIKVACLKEDPDTILGYSVYRNLSTEITVLDWIFIKSNWRNIGIAKSLIPAHTNAYTHVTKSGLSIVKEKYPHMVYNPFLF